MSLETFWYQQRVNRWVIKCLGIASARDQQERNARFIEEAIELVQARGATKTDVQAAIDYVFARPSGEAKQEIGGVMVCLAALATQEGVVISDAAYEELVRIEDPATMVEVRLKQSGKPSAIRGENT